MKAYSNNEDSSQGFWGTRFTFAVMAFLGFVITFVNRVELSVAIVAMVKRDGNDTSGSIGMECPISEGDGLDEANSGEFDWDSREQGLILGSFSFGYVTTQLVGGILAEMYGAKWIFGGSIFFSAVLDFLVPIAAKSGVISLVLIRATQGAFQGPSYPALYAMAAKWLPVQEKNRLLAIICVGAQMGTMSGMVLSGFITEAFGWEATFYFVGGAGTLWFLGWVFLAFNSPAVHPRISKAELKHIEANVPTDIHEKLPFPPLRKIFACRAYWALQITHIGGTWGMFTLLTAVPTYLNNIQHVTLAENGIYSALPYATLFVMVFPISFLADYLINSGTMSVLTVRKLMNSFAYYGAAAGLISLAFIKCNLTLAVIALCVSVGCYAGSFVGFGVNGTDIAPNYSGSLMGLSNTIANFSGFITPMVTGAITDGNQTFAAWRRVFLLAAGIYVSTNTVFLFFGSASVQPWNNPQRNKMDEEKSVQ